jgi:hypothetical protein
MSSAETEPFDDQCCPCDGRDIVLKPPDSRNVALAVTVVTLVTLLLGGCVRRAAPDIRGKRLVMTV